MQLHRPAPICEPAAEPTPRPVPESIANLLDLDDLEFFRPLPVSLN